MMCNCAYASRYVVEGPNGRATGGYCPTHGLWQIALPQLDFWIPFGTPFGMVPGTAQSPLDLVSGTTNAAIIAGGAAVAAALIARP